MQVITKVVITAAISAMGILGADNLPGTWKLNPAKSTNTSANPANSRTDVYEATADGGYKVTTTQQRKDGAADNYSFTVKPDGKEYPVTGASFDTVSVKRVNANTTSFEVVKKSDGTSHQTGRNIVSKDGKTRTLIAKGTDAKGKPFNARLVFDKQ